jgi:hypothetical protein
MHCVAPLLQAWSLFSVFLSTILGLVLGPMPVGAWAFCALTFTLITKTLTWKAAMAAFTNEVIWLIVVSFFFAKVRHRPLQFLCPLLFSPPPPSHTHTPTPCFPRPPPHSHCAPLPAGGRCLPSPPHPPPSPTAAQGFEKTGLGERIANIFVMLMGKSTLGLAYGLMIAETLLSPAMPSSTARAGGIFMPIIKFLSKAAGGCGGGRGGVVCFGGKCSGSWVGGWVRGVF